MNSRTADKFVVRLEDTMRARIQEIAKSHHRSMNSQMLAWLEMCILYEEKTGSPLTPDAINKPLLSMNTNAEIRSGMTEEIHAVAPGLPARWKGQLCIVEKYEMNKSGLSVRIQTSENTCIYIPANEIRPV